MKSKPNRKPQINKGTRKSAFILSVNSSAAMHPAPLNQGLNHPELKIINLLNLRKIRLHGHCSNGLHFWKIARSENSPRRINRYHFKFQSNEPEMNNFENPTYYHIYDKRLPEMAKFRKSPFTYSP